MSGVFVDTPYSGVNLDNLALDPHGCGAIRKEPPQRTMRLADRYTQFLVREPMQ